MNAPTRESPIAIPRLEDIIDALAEQARVVRARPARAGLPARAALLAISGIDGSGKGTVAAEVVRGLERRGLRVALIPLDPWHQPPKVRFSTLEPGAHFYRNAFRWEAMFGQVVDPLVRDRSIRTIAWQIRLRDGVWYTHTFDVHDVDVVLLEGIFLFRRELRARYDATLWIECSFERALERALARNQEGLPRERLIADYETIYFPAQRVHLERDDPRGFAGAVLVNE